MKKKLGVLIGGLLKEFEIAKNYWSFLNDIEHDIYFSTWDVTYEKNEFYNIDIREVVTEERILKYFPNAKITINTDNFLTTIPSKIDYHWKTLFKMVEESNVDYDYLLLTRPDMAFKEIESISHFIKNINDDYLYTLGPVCFSKPPGIIYIMDCLFIGKTHVMKDIFTTLYVPKEWHPNDIHYHIAKHIVAKDIYIEDIHASRRIVDYTVVRALNRKFPDISFDDRKQLFREQITNTPIDEIRKKLGI
jgi:hypothetical protein